MFDPSVQLTREGCSVARALSVLGERWTLLVLREAFYGVRRFDDMLQAIGCARNLLAARLATLVDEGVLDKVPYREEGQRARTEYRLTPKGQELFPILIALMQWGDRWRPAPAGPPVVILHRTCQTPIVAELRCAHGHGPLGAHEAEPHRARRKTPPRGRVS